MDNKEKTKYISASTEPFSEEMEIDEYKMVNWLDFFNINYDYERKEGRKFFVRRHVSGHASKNELRIDKQDKPKKLSAHSHRKPKVVRGYVSRESHFAQICSTN